MLRLREIRTLDELEQVQEPWTRLLHRVDNATPFQSWEWIFEFARFDNIRLRISVLERPDGEWAGVLPLCERSTLFPGIRILELIGGRVSDYPGLMAEPEHLAAVQELAHGWLSDHKNRRTMYLRSQRHGLPAWAPRHPSKVASGEETVIIRLADSPEKFFATLSRNLRRNLGRDDRRITEVNVDFRTPATEAELRAEMPVLFDLHQARMNSVGERGRFFDPRWCNTLTHIAVRLLHRGITTFTVLRINGTPAAASFDMRLHRKQYSYQCGMNPQFLAFSPGRLLTWYMLREAIGAGVHIYDFGRGLEDYKLQWSKELLPVEDLIVARSGAALEIWLAVQRARQTVLRSTALKKIYLATMGAS